MLTRKTMLLAAGALTLGAIACNKTETENTPTTTSNTPPPSGAATITGATVQTDPLANAENKGRVKEYPDQTKIDPPKPAQLITGFSVQVRESPRGEVVTTTEIADNVKEVAKDAHGDYYLVVFADPKDSTKQLAGWVYKDALENNAWSRDNSTTTQAAAGASPNAKTGNVAGAMSKLSCARGQSHVRTTMDFCAKTCKDDKGCDKTAGEICDGLGFEVHESTGKLSNTNYCISSTSPNANKAHASEHGSSAPLDDMNKNQ